MRGVAGCPRTGGRRVFVVETCGLHVSTTNSAVGGTGPLPQIYAWACGRLLKSLSDFLIKSRILCYFEACQGRGKSPPAWLFSIFVETCRDTFTNIENTPRPPLQGLGPATPRGGFTKTPVCGIPFRLILKACTRYYGEINDQNRLFCRRNRSTD